jgi:hypothetical protein
MSHDVPRTEGSEQPHKTVPTFRPTDKVRIMATDEMLARGHANKTGVVFAIWKTEGKEQECRLQCGNEAITVLSSHLMHVK